MRSEYIAVPAETDTAAEAVAAGKQTVLTELQRGDAKATSLLGLFGAFFAGVIALTRTGASVSATVLLLLAALPTGAAVVLLLWTIRPRLPGAYAGFTRWALFEGNPAGLVDDIDRTAQHDLDDEAHHLAVLSRLAVTKYERINTAVVLLLAGMALAVLALFVA